MTAINREPAISKTLTYEGGYTNNPKDPGGPTNWGITIFDARLYWKHDATAADVKAMPKSVAIDIYRQKYWAKIDCDAQPTGPDFADFDLSVNSGVGKVRAWRPLFSHLTPVEYVKALCAKRSSFLHSLRTWAVFGPGWGKRVADVEATGVRMAVGAAGKPVAPVLHKEADKAAKKTLGHSTAAATTTATTAPALHNMDFTTKTGIAIACVVAGVAILFFVWHAVQNAHRASAYASAAKG